MQSYQGPNNQLFQSTMTKVHQLTDPQRKIEILEHVFNNGLQIKPVDTYWMGWDIVTIKFFINHESCTTEHLIHLFENCKYDPASSLLCIEHPKFPTCRDEYIKHRGRSLSSTFSDYFNNISDIKYQGYLANLIQLVFKKCPQLLNQKELKSLEENLHVYSKEIEKKKEEDMLFHISSHPEYTFVLSEFDLKCAKNHPSSYTFYLAAKNGYKEIFYLFYFHQDTPDEAKKYAIQLLCENSQTNLIKNISYLVVRSHHEINLLTFYISMMRSENQLLHNMNELILLIMNTFIKAELLECNSSMQDTYKLPAYYKNTKIIPTLFQKNPVNANLMVPDKKQAMDDELENQQYKPDYA